MTMGGRRRPQVGPRRERWPWKCGGMLRAPARGPSWWVWTSRA